MSDRYNEIRRESGHMGNCIPSGQQLPRTPPMMDVKRHLDFCNEDQNEDCEETQQGAQAGSRNQEENELNRTFDFNPLEIKTKPDDPTSMLKGMKGYQLTQSDLEFIEKMKEEKLAKKLQGDLEEIQRLLKNQMMAFELTCATREKAQAELQKFPSCEDLTRLMKVVLKTSTPLTDLTDLDAKSLLAMVTEEDVQTAMAEKRIELTRMEKMVANKKKKEAKLEKKVAAEQMKIQGLMSQLFTLKSELTQQEEANKALELQISTQKAQESKVEAEEVKTSDEPQATKVNSRGKERKNAVKSKENVQDSNQSKSTKSKVTEGKKNIQTGVQRSRKPAAAEDQPNPGLRRSKRIANRT
ncbi:axoneme-associated protein mst101(3)-like [Labrus bergylta]|uniref:axoneme-associated protein mst101(3)-like n=1 Tax=Labrus bergylta TaxID=56723 RepID=UPI0033132433